MHSLEDDSDVKFTGIGFIYDLITGLKLMALLLVWGVNSEDRMNIKVF